MRIFKEEDLEKELWKPMFGYEEYCETSTLGRIKVLKRTCIDKRDKQKTIKEKILTLGYYSNGYEQFSLSVDNVRYTGIVHRLIAKTFIPNPENYPVVNHKNGVRDDNRVENLEWCTQSYNSKHAFKELGREIRDMKGENNARTKLTEKEVIAIKKEYSEGVLPKSIYTTYSDKVSFSAFRKICGGQTWKHINLDLL
jgi:hypothetical protein